MGSGKFLRLPDFKMTWLPNDIKQQVIDYRNLTDEIIHQLELDGGLTSTFIYDAMILEERRKKQYEKGRKK